MTASTEVGGLDSDADSSPLGDRWRERARREQRAAMPRGDVVLTCSAPLGTGGLGRHLSELEAAVRSVNERPPICISGDRPARDSLAGESRAARGDVRIPSFGRILARIPLVAPGVRTWAHMSEFDSLTKRSLPRADHLIAFNGQALAQLRAARRAGYESVALVSANSHMRQVQRRHAEARERYPLEGSWTTHMLARNLAEYALADRVYCATDYIRDSFLEQGVPEQRLVPFPLTPDPRYAPLSPAHDGLEREPGGGRSGRDSGSSRFEIVYVGSLHVHKGVPLLIDAVRRLAHADLALTLVGGWGTRGMRRFVQGACAADRRIVVAPGDPLPHLRRAALCAHPAYEDGFGYAPAEALACGVPVLVSEDTGMKELIDSPRRGLTLPTGDLDALAQAIDAAYRGELFAR
ncbi:MAG TPA: glycosyltransferase family 4 protein [Solirubrobacteraceae bacterium]|nr:glycosyltransferase family 4 protein [Solirubrobacteraceae bacterium]